MIRGVTVCHPSRRSLAIAEVPLRDLGDRTILRLPRRADANAARALRKAIRDDSRIAARHSDGTRRDRGFAVIVRALVDHGAALVARHPVVLPRCALRLES